MNSNHEGPTAASPGDARRRIFTLSPKHHWSLGALFIVLSSLCTPVRSTAQDPLHGQPDAKYGIREQQQFSAQEHGRPIQSVASPWFDVTHYRLDLHIHPALFLIEGSVTIRGVCDQEQPQFLTFDLMSPMTIDSAAIDRHTSTVSRQSASFTLGIDSLYHLGDILTATIYYHGVPGSTGLGSFVISQHDGIPWIWSLSEPYGARDWWPCKDTPADKADSADMIITTDSTLRVGSNGTLDEVVQNGDGTATWHWKEHYPITTYLISVAITNYAAFSNWFHYTPGDSMQVLNYVLPESLSTAMRSLPVAVEGLKVFSGLYGLYPFIREKYGHAQFGGLGMEHQTMTSLPTFDEETIIHELAHQWFGDMITCRSWPHVWLNEGFATYSQALFHENTDGPASYALFMTNQMARARLAVGSVYALDTTDVRALFNGPRVYSKGAVVLHMLRHILGDTLFFRSIRAYAGDTTLRYGVATTEDFQRDCEQVSHLDLGYFFQEWIYGENYPHYSYAWTTSDSAGSTVLKISLAQNTGTLNPVFFTMPVDFRVSGASWDSTFTLLNNAARQDYTVYLPRHITSLQLDPGEWILKDASGGPAENLPSGFELFQNYPNPFNTTTRIRYSVQHRTHIRIDILNVLGIRISTLFDGIKIPGTYTVDWDGSSMPSGTYYYRLTAGKFTETQKMSLVK